MIPLNLETKNDSQKIIKAYLEENSSQPFADKINNGVCIEKDGKMLINKKDLDGFWAYATKKAQELKSQYMDNDTVFCWAVHYFGEDDIEGTLYNEDGSEYIRPQPTTKAIQRVPAPTVQAKPTPPKTQQFNMFDLLAAEKQDEPALEETSTPAVAPPPEETKDVQECYFDEEDVDLETGEILRFKTRNPEQGSPFYQKYLSYKNQYPAHIVAYRVGEFFEFFGNDAIRLSNFMNLTLTSRECGLDERVAMVGIPYHASEPYFMKIAANYKLAIVDNGKVEVMETEELLSVNESITDNEKHKLLTGDLEDNEPDNDDFEKERALQQFFDKEALCTLYELFDYNLDLQ